MQEVAAEAGNRPYVSGLSNLPAAALLSSVIQNWTSVHTLQFVYSDRETAVSSPQPMKRQERTQLEGLVWVRTEGVQRTSALPSATEEVRSRGAADWGGEVNLNVSLSHHGAGKGAKITTADCKTSYGADAVWHPLMCQRHKLPHCNTIIHQRGAASPETYHRARLSKQETLALTMLLECSAATTTTVIPVTPWQKI